MRTDAKDLRLRRDVALVWAALPERPDRELVLVVDAANVVGSRPDGWWRDRKGATERLRDKLAVLSVSGWPGTELEVAGGGEWSRCPRVMLVVEGRAKGTVSLDNVEIVSAAADGDAEIVKVVKDIRARRPGDHVVVVTADRELRSRIEAERATVLGPGMLLSLLDKA